MTTPTPITWMDSESWDVFEQLVEDALSSYVETEGNEDADESEETAQAD